MAENRPLNDAMDARRLTARWVIRATLTLETAMHLGGEGSERVDMPVLREPREGRPLLPGTTLAGALRNALADRLAGYGEDEPGEIAALFGGVRGDDDGYQSPLIVFDSLGGLPTGQGTELRDGVAISPTTGTAEDHKKYDYEVLPAGTTFPVRLDLLLPAPSSATHTSPVEENALLGSLAAVLGALSDGEICFGAKRSRGLGRVRAVWSARRYDVSSQDGWLEWLRTDHTEPFTAFQDQSCVREAIEAAAPERLEPLSLPSDARARVVVDLDLQVVHDLLVRSPATTPAAPNVTHLQSGGAAILPGTSLAGVVRAHALRIAKLVREHPEAKLWVDRLFGPRFEGQRPAGGETPQASRLRTGETRLRRSQPRRQTRIAIDRFTQGVADSALFDEQPEIGGRATVRLELRNPHEGELGLMLLVVKDLLDGTLPVGGTSGVGRGELRGAALITWYAGNGATPTSASVTPGQAPARDAAVEINNAIRAFHNAPPLSAEPETSRPENIEGSP